MVHILRFIKVRVYDKSSHQVKQTTLTKLPLVAEIKQAGTISAKDLQLTERGILQSIQKERFRNLIEGHSGKSGGRLERNLGVRSEQGLLRCRGRLEKADLTRVQRFPVLLPTKHAVTDLIIRHVHQRNLHCGTQSTLGYVLDKYWIPKGSSK